MKKIIIIGAGISGLFLANLLEKSGKYDYEILEKKSRIKLFDGYGIQLSVNGVKLLNKIDFNKILIHKIFYPQNVNFFQAKNCKLISKINISKFNDKNIFYTTLKRSVLLDFLISNIPKDKITFNSDIQGIYQNRDIKIKIKDKKEIVTDYLAICDGVFSKSKYLVTDTKKNIKFYKSVALRGTLKNVNNRDISIYLGSNFHFVTYAVNQNHEFNFISIIRENDLKKVQLSNQNQLIKNYINFLSSNTSLEFKNNIENLSIYPVFVSKKFIAPKNKNIYFAGDALFSFPPSFAQGASQSIETAYEIFKNLEGEERNYHSNREIKTKTVKFRSEFNHFAFHVSNPLTVFIRNITLKYLSKNNRFLEYYLGRIYR